MALFETESIVLRSYNLSEADKIVVFLTHDHGIIRGVAKGVKRLKSKFGSSLEPFSVVRLSYIQKDSVELVSIDKAELIRSYFASASDPDFLQKFSYLGELLITLSPPHDPNKVLYRMVSACLDATAAVPGNLLNVGLYFELWLLRLSGYLPDWDRCHKCGRQLNETENADLGPNYFLHCLSCRKAAGNRVVDGGQRQLFAAAQRFSPIEFVNFARTERSRSEELSSILKKIISQSIGREVVVERSLSLRT